MTFPWKNPSVSCLALAVAMAISHPPGGLEAQTVPGVQRDQFGAIAEYRAGVFEELKTVLDQWERLVLRGDAALEALYSEEALFLLQDGTTLIGKLQVAEEVLSRFSRTGGVELQALDFAMSDRIAVIGGRMAVSDRETSSASERCFSMVFRREDRSWRIRSQTFCEVPERSLPAGS